MIAARVAGRARRVGGWHLHVAKRHKTGDDGDRSFVPRFVDSWVSSSGIDKRSQDRLAETLKEIGRRFEGEMKQFESDLKANHDQSVENLKEVGEYVSSMMNDYFGQENLARRLQNLPATGLEGMRRERRPVNYVKKSDIDKKTNLCIAKLRTVLDLPSPPAGEVIALVEELNEHLARFPYARLLATRLGGVGLMLKALEGEDPSVRLVAKESLAQLGHVQPLKSKGIRILCVDGGGMKGVVAVEILRRLEHLTGKRIHELFDLVAGVSSGSVIAGLLAVKKFTVAEVESVYDELGVKVFQQSLYGGMTGIVKSHAFYDTANYQSLIKSFAEEMTMAATARLDAPKVAVVASLVSEDVVVPYVFRNYNFPAMATSNYRGSSRHKVWEAILASSSAPGFFDEFIKGREIFQDGGVITNNATHIGIHEARKLWPNESLHCVVSVGLGRYEPRHEDQDAADEPLLIDQDADAVEGLGMKGLTIPEKFSRLVMSATDTETVHNTLYDLLPPEVYFRFNPSLSERYPLDETRPFKVKQMSLDASKYCQRNQNRIKQAAERLLEPASLAQKAKRRFIQKPN